MKAMKLGFGDEETSPWESKKHPDPYYDLTQDDADLIGFANYFTFYHKRCVETMDSTQMANFAHDLARRLGKAYHKEKINDGRYGFQYAINHANTILQRCMWTLGMFRLEQV
jgi:arginyl-tRNA synthetase